MNKKKEIKLRPCPFRHGKKYGKKQDLYVVIEEGMCNYVRCRICNAAGPTSMSEYWATKKWNEKAGRK